MPDRTFLSTLLIAISTAAVSILTIMVAAKFIGPLPLSLSQTVTQKQNTFDVTGEIEVSVVPDTANVSLGIEVTKPTAAEAQTQANQVMSQLVSTLGGIGIEKKDIKTQNYTVYPDYTYDNGQRRANGFRVSSNVSVKIRDFAKINTVIDSAVQVGATNVGGISFTLSEDKEREVKAQARKDAIAKAKDNAQELSDLAGMRLGKIVNVFEGSSQPPVLYNKRTDLALEAADAMAEPTQIEPGTNSYTYTVTLSYETL